MICFGIGNNSPDKILSALVKRQVVASESEVGILSFGKLLGETPKRAVIFVLSITDLFHNLRVLNSPNYADVQIFVFASPLRLNELGGCTLLDIETLSHHPLNGMKLGPPNWLRHRTGFRQGSRPVKREDRLYLTVLTDNVKRGSLLTPLMTFIYTLPGAQSQTMVKESIARYLSGLLSLEKLKVETSQLGAKHKVTLDNLVTSDIAHNYRNAFSDWHKLPQEQRNQRKTLENLCTTHGTSLYEIRYLLSVMKSMDDRKHFRGKTIPDTLRKS